MTRGLFGPGTLVLGGGAVLLVAFLVTGMLLPGTWTARAEALVDAEPSVVMGYLDSPEGWRAWTPWPDSTVRSGPERGAGAGMRWDSEEFGSGSFRLDAVESDGVRYSVEVAGTGGSAMRTSGALSVERRAAGTHVSWTEEGDLGSNPLMGWWALSMDRAQSVELGKSLDRLAEVIREAADSVRSGSGPSR